MELIVRASNATIGIRDGLIVEPAHGEAFDQPRCTVHPGFVDQHCHGGAGHAFGDGDVDAIVAAHLRAGTTSLMASLVSAPREVMVSQVLTLAPRVHDGTLVGIHLEGPWLAPSRCGAHDPQALREPTMDEARALLDAGGGAVRMVTIAPELAGAAEVIAYLVDRGVIVAIGHTDCTEPQARQAIAAGATVATHLFNAMPAPHHREPGPIPALLADPRVIVELIADGVHVAPSILALVGRAAGPSRTALVSDAMAAACMGDGRYALGSLDVAVVDAIARLAGTSTLAGSTLTMAGAVRTMAKAVGDLGTAVDMATATPARCLGLDDRGALEPGMRADLVLLDSDAQVRGVMHGGSWVLTPA